MWTVLLSAKLGCLFLPLFECVACVAKTGVSKSTPTSKSRTKSTPAIASARIAHGRILIDIRLVVRYFHNGPS